MMCKKLSLHLLVLSLVVATPLYAEEKHDDEHQHSATETQHTDADNHEEEGHNDAGHEASGHGGHDDDEEGGITLSKEQLDTAGIIVTDLTAHSITPEIDAPGEIILNAYASSRVTPRIDAQVIERHANMGDHVNKGQSLVTLSSVGMAEAQGELLIAAKEWQRVKKLGRKVVSEKRHLGARVAYQQSQAKLIAYGMTQKQINILISGNNISKANGQFDLLANQDGTIIHDDFILGQMVSPGDLLFEITDESTLWVQARVKPEYMSLIKIGAMTRINLDGNWIQGKVIQIHHALDQETRTLAVRLEIDNPDDNLHPGQFVIAKIESNGSKDAALTLPKNAVLRSPDGDWQVFIEHEPGKFEPQEVEVVRQLSDSVVIEGLKPGTRVVTQGAFFVQSEIAKSGFSVHNH
jgi:RND family efflux transporter MFP subunit